MMMTAVRFLYTATVFVLGALSISKADTPKNPNYIFISIDDLGYADIGPFGSQLNRTPHLNRMAKEGRRLTSFYAAPVCSPSRAALMTGSYPKRALPIPGVLFPAYDHGLSPDEVTIAEVLKTKGYATAIIGKWHLGDQPELLPRRQGFDYWFGLPYSNDMGPVEDGIKSSLGQPLRKVRSGKKQQPPLPLMRNETVLKRVLPDDQQAIVELYTNEAVRFLRENKDRHFFLYLPHSAVHFPIYPGKKFAGQSPNGIYSDWVEELDWSVGRVLDTVRELGLDRKTFVIFTSDNGGTRRGLNTPLRGHKGSTWEGGMRVPTIAWWPGTIPSGTSTGAITGMIDILPTFAKLAGAELPANRKLDGVDIWPHIVGKVDAAPAHDVFYYFRGLKLQAVRKGHWKLHLAKKQLFHLIKDIGETNDVSAVNPDLVKALLAVAQEMDSDLGLEGKGPGCRPLGRVKNPLPLINPDGTIRKGFESK
ncbi:MAG TPA: arylsulfatase [Verrucomicrobiales bacterium]|nr:arylsulfatase [Verrucomicrobiales bacterium]